MDRGSSLLKKTGTPINMTKSNSSNSFSNEIIDLRTEQNDHHQRQFCNEPLSNRCKAPSSRGSLTPPSTQHQFQTIGRTSGKNKKLFPQKLWELINDDKYNFCLRWSEDGQLVYLNRDEFEDFYLKTAENQFHTQKAISFVRQMNMYGFRKVDDCYYENDNFKRDCEHLLKNMIRKHPNKNAANNSLELPPCTYQQESVVPHQTTMDVNSDIANFTMLCLLAMSRYHILPPVPHTQ